MKGSVLMALQSTRKSLAETNPELAAQWHPTKNGDLTPKQVSRSARMKVWWICNQGHEWQATIANRNRGSNCLYCTNTKVLKGFNDLQTLNPTLAKEWNYKRNGELTPQDVMPYSNKKVWWICNQGHEWPATINHRMNGSACPVCHKGRATSFPESAVYFYVKQKYADAIQSYKPYWLKPMEIDIFIPSLNLGIEYDGAQWHRDIEHDNKKNMLCATHNINLIRIREPSCPKIDGQNIIMNSTSDVGLEKAIVFLFQRYLQLNVDINIQRDITKIRNIISYSKPNNSLSQCNPSLALEWHPIKNGKLTPEHVGPYSNKKVWWKCNRGHEWQSTIRHRNDGRGCPYCLGRRPVKGENDLATINPTLAKEWNYEKNHELLPSDVLPHSKKKVWWKCSVCQHEWQTSIYNRSRGTRCPVCAQNTKVQTQKQHMKEKRLGEVNTMKSGMQCKIINYINSANVVVEFENKVTKRATYSNFKKGAVSPN